MAHTTIDHAIAIPTKQIRVWSVLSDLSKNSVWQADCEGIAFLSTMHTGRGTRWRNTTASGREQVLEINAWYDGLGYEYIVVDGLKVANAKGRIRLQETAEGTMVQWTFSYDMQGFLSGVRNSLSVKRGFDRDIIDSLQNLYSYIKSLMPDEQYDVADLRSMMRDAPTVEERLQYQTADDDPRNVNAMPIAEPVVDDDRFKPPVSQSMPAAPIVIEEPPLSDEDTKPNPAVQEQLEPATDRDVAPDRLEEPSFLRDLPTDKPKQPPEPAPAAFDAVDDQPLQAPAPDITEPAIEPETPAQIEPDQPVAVPDAKDEQAPAPAEMETERRPVAEPLSYDRQDVGKLDTARISVFEVFGLQKPSESELIRTITDAELAEYEEENKEPSTSKTSEPVADGAATKPPNADAVATEPPVADVAEPVANVTAIETPEVSKPTPASATGTNAIIQANVLPDDTAIRRQRIGLRVRLRNHQIKVRRPQ